MFRGPGYTQKLTEQVAAPARARETERERERGRCGGGGGGGLAVGKRGRAGSVWRGGGYN